MKFAIAALIAAGMLASAPAQAEDDLELDFLAGQYDVLDADGTVLGQASVHVRIPGAVIEEDRRIGERAPQLMWLARLEHADGWTQIFQSPAGMREFPRLSPKGAWPIVFGGDVTLASGAPASFRLTISGSEPAKHRRLLEISRDGGESWATVFDYTYRRVSSPEG